MENKEIIIDNSKVESQYTKDHVNKPTPSAVDELDLEERALKLYPVVMYNDTDSFTPKQYDNNLYNRTAYIAGWNDHAQIKQSKNVAVIEALEHARQWIDGKPASQYTIELIDNALTKLKQ